MKKIEYDETFLKIVHELSSISEQKENKNSPIRIVKDEEGVHVRARNMPGTIAFFLDAPSNHFSFDSDIICFYHYPEFHKYIEAFKKPELYYGLVNEGQESEYEGIVISKDRKKIAYEVSDPEVTKGSALKSRKVNNTDASFNFTSENLTQIRKIISLFSDKKLKINFAFKDKTVKVYIFSERNSNTFEDEFELDSPVETDYELCVDKEIFEHLINTNYKVLASRENQFLEFQFESEAIRGFIAVQSEN